MCFGGRWSGQQKIERAIYLERFESIRTSDGSCWAVAHHTNASSIFWETYKTVRFDKEKTGKLKYICRGQKV